jgi:hypothetical protein
MVRPMDSAIGRPTGTCPLCHRLDVSHRVTIGAFTRVTCRMCANSYKRTPGVTVTIEELASYNT